MTVDLTKIKLLISIPAYDAKVSTYTMGGVLQTIMSLKKAGADANFFPLENDSFIPHARTRIANTFVNNTNFTHLLCVDSDIGFNAQDVADLIMLDVPFATKAYRMKCEEIRLCFQDIDNSIIHPNGFAKTISRIGTGFQLISRKVFERMQSDDIKFTPSKFWHLTGTCYHYYHPILEPGGESLTEDYSFCKRWIQTGGQIWMSTRVALDHYGAQVWRGFDMQKYQAIDTNDYVDPPQANNSNIIPITSGRRSRTILKEESNG